MTIARDILRIIEDRWGTNFSGDDTGNWESKLILSNDWTMTCGLSLKNDRKNYSVEGATEDHPGFRKALDEIVKKYPYIKDYLISFDGPYIKISDVLKRKKFSWKDITLYHGTASAFLDSIKKNGLSPRSVTNQNAGYGSFVGAKSGNKDAIYLTTQIGMAKFAGLEVSSKTNSDRIILSVNGKDLNPKLLIPDEDSRKQTPEDSLFKIGSVGYLGIIPFSQLSRS